MVQSVETVLELAKQGKFEDIDARFMVRNFANIEKINARFAKNTYKINRVRPIWVVGKPGIGKSTWAREGKD